MRYDLRESARRRDSIALSRLETLVPELMAEHSVDCWVIVSREYADDAISMTMLPADWMSTRRRTILVFFASDDAFEKLSVSRYDTSGFFAGTWDPSEQEDQWAALAAILHDRNPRQIAINLSEDFAHADGLTSTQHSALKRALGPLADRLVAADSLGVAWLERRTPPEKDTMDVACREAHSILRRALSPEAVTPGVTTTDDVKWWLRRQVQELGTTTWFQPEVSLQRRGDAARGSFAAKPGGRRIEAGDLIHIDFGIVWDGLCTDQQQHGYVLLPGEESPPDWIDGAMTAGNRLQDILTGQFELGRTGNEILALALEAASAEGLRGTIYTHPIGFHGHGAGPTIGLWDNQNAIEGSGDRRLESPTAWSIELNVSVDVPDWDDQRVAIMLEEDAWFDGSSVSYLDGRQTEVWPIG